MLEWFEEIHKEKNSLESANQPLIQMIGEFAHSNGIEFDLLGDKHAPLEMQSLSDLSLEQSNEGYEISIPAMTLQ